MVLHSLCARRRGLRHHRHRRRCRRRVATRLGDLWRNATSPFLPWAAFSRASLRWTVRLSESRWRILRRLVTYVRTLRSTSMRFISTPCVKGEWWKWRTTLFARRSKHRPVSLRGRLNFETMRVLWEQFPSNTAFWFNFNPIRSLFFYRNRTKKRINQTLYICNIYNLSNWKLSVILKISNLH